MQTAIDHGSEVNTAGFIDPLVARTGRLKGQDRIRAIKAGKSTNVAPAPVGNTSRKYVTTEEILRQANFLHGLDSTYTMPQKVARCYKAALAMRERYAAWYEKDPTADPRDNEGHRYFNSVMRDVATLLKGRIRVQSGPSAVSQPVTISGGDDTLSPLLENMQLEEPDADEIDDEVEEESRSAPGPVAKKVAKPPRAVYVPKLSKIEEVRIKWLSLLEDASRSLDISAEIWVLCRHGNPSLNAGIASFIIEAGVAWVGFRETELQKEASKFDSSLVLPMEAIKSEELHHILSTLHDVAQVQKQRKASGMVSLQPLDERQFPSGDPRWNNEDREIIHYLSDLQLDTASVLPSVTSVLFTNRS